ncbi:MAG TPA: thermonuclease family protein [Acidimicrobiales bacterium]|nr:thermonuclease family protein [Acidimicrobiales bacterium]
MARRRGFALVGIVLALVSGCGTGVGVRSTGPEPVAGPEVSPAPAATGEVTVPAAPGRPAAEPATGLPATGLPAGDDAVVEQVVDGDTLVVSGGIRVRLIGIDTPETKDPRQGVQCFGPEASDEAAALVAPGTAVRLVYDVERLDRYGRTLAYVYRRDDGLFVNAALVAGGFAQPATFPPNVAHADHFAALAGTARDEGRGLWGACGTGAPPAAEPLPTPVPPPPAVAPAPSAARSCDASYPGVCVPPAPPDLDCGEIPDRRFAVTPPDPHGFDGDGDGVGCESG